MTEAELRAAVVEAVLEVAPDLEPDELEDDVDLYRDLDLDSMDCVQIVAALHRRLGVTVPEADYPHLQSVGSTVRYLQAQGR